MTASSRYGIKIAATLKDGSKVTDAEAWIINKQRVYKTKDGEELVGDKAVVSIEEFYSMVPPSILLLFRDQAEVKT